MMTAIICFLKNETKYTLSKRHFKDEIFSQRFCGTSNEGVSFNELEKKFTQNGFDEEWSNLAIIRDPIERFVSGFVDKCVLNREWMKKSSICGGCKMDIKCFIEVLYDRMYKRSINGEKLNNFDDQHFFPQNWRCEFYNHFIIYKVYFVHYHYYKKMSVEDLRISSISARPEFHRMSTSSTNLSPGLSGNKYVKVVTEVHSSRTSGNGGAPHSFGQNAASSIRDTRERERKEMSDLNDKLANYIEKVRFLEAQNRKLNADLEMLKGKTGTHASKIRVIFEHELTEAKTLIDTTEKQKDEFENQLKKLQKDIDEYKTKYEETYELRQQNKKIIDDLLVKLSDIEAEINLLKRRIALLEEEIGFLKKENISLNDELKRTRSALDHETLDRIDFQNQLTTLLEEIDFIKRNQDEEIKDLLAMASRDTTSENREYFKSELASAIRDIRDEYDKLNNNSRNDLESWYKLKIQEINTQSARQSMEQNHQKEELKRLKTNVTDLRSKLADLEGRNALLEKQIEDLNYQIEDDQRSYEAALNEKDVQIRKMREECQALMVELQMLLDAKQTLDSELAIYRKMLEGEGDGTGLRQLVEQVVRTTGINEVADTETMRVVKGETSSRSSYSRSAKGIVSIQETAEDGTYILLENTHRNKEENIGEWKLKRKIDNKQEIVYTFPKDFILKPFKNVKIFAKGAGPHNPPESLVFDKDNTFGSGNNVVTILYNKDGEEKATHTKRTSSN